MKLNRYKLTKWRRLLLVRDSILIVRGDKSIRSPYCPMCSIPHPSWRIQAHHIFPKSKFPELAYDLKNGICLCMNCHMHIVHSGNSFRDIQQLEHWRFFIPTFTDYNAECKNKTFNQDNQDRITG